VRALLLLAALAVLPACPTDESCGPSDAVGDGLVLAGSGVNIRYHDLHAGANNDCPDAAAPEGVVSLTIAGIQVGGSDGITFCVPRPDLLADPLPLGTGIEIVDIGAAADGCTYVRNTVQAPGGTANAEGICMNGTDPAGFAFVVNGQVSVDRTCNGNPTETLRLDLTGVVSVVSP
jgi:hypothetical protein